MVGIAHSRSRALLGFVALLLGASTCVDDGPGGASTAASSSGGESSGSSTTGLIDPSVTSLATGADTTAGVATTATDGTSTGLPGTSSSEGTSSSTTGDASTTGASTGSSGSSSSEGGPACGDGVAQPGEQCDGADLQGFDCDSLGLGDGDLGCDPVACVFDVSDCGGVGNCGNGVIDVGEQCDGADLQGFDCASLGLVGGVLSCDPVMCTFDTSMCMPGGGTSG